ncbi:leucine-rich repeat protein, partial [Hepatocystis sp. ex Piliocolobus tephrosceles]
EDEINEYYSFKENITNTFNNFEDYISNSYNKLSNCLIEDKKQNLFLMSRERISEIKQITNNFNDLFYSYLHVLNVQ